MSYFDLGRVELPEATSGPWRIERFEVKEDSPGRISYAMHGRPVPPGKYTRLMRTGAWEPMMSDTPAEIMDHWDAIEQIQERGGRILLNGLGLGMVLKAALAFPNVNHVDVVEIDQDIAKLVWPFYSHDGRATLHMANAFDVQWSEDARWTVAWHDIWESLCADNLPEMAKLHRKYGKRVDWQGSWGRAAIREHQRRFGW